ncbi:MAG: glutaredoxin 3 [Cardiobacteriaceae bacterium]|nr:glutaredoxin 3 [Cardiobacteriaceae bacterium]
MKQVEMYIKPTCPYCQRALALMAKKGVSPVVVDITQEPHRRDEMIERAGGRTTVPQIFVGGQHIGGCDDAHALDAEGRLDALLKA